MVRSDICGDLKEQCPWQREQQKRRLRGGNKHGVRQPGKPAWLEQNTGRESSRSVVKDLTGPRSHWAIRARIRSLDLILNVMGESLEGCEQGNDKIKSTFSLRLL